MYLNELSFILGMMGVIWYIGWVLIVTESPASYGNITQQELEYIQQSIGYTETQAKVINIHFNSLKVLIFF